MMLLATLVTIGAVVLWLGAAATVLLLLALADEEIERD